MTKLTRTILLTAVLLLGARQSSALPVLSGHDLLSSFLGNPTEDLQVAVAAAKFTSGGVTYGGGIEQTLSLTTAQLSSIYADIKSLIKTNGPTAAPTAVPSTRTPVAGRGRRLLQRTAAVDYTYCGNPISQPSPYNTTAELAKCLDVAAGMVQLAFHDAGTYVKATGKGGPDGCVNIGLPENNGFKFIIPILQPVYEKYATVISYADFVAYAAKVAIETVGGGAAPIPFKYGRKTRTTCGDGDNGDDVGQLPQANKNHKHIEDVFVTRMGLTVQDITALMGAHTIGRMEDANTGYSGYWDSTPNKWDNKYYAEMIQKWWQRTNHIDTSGKKHVDWFLHAAAPAGTGPSATYVDPDPALFAATGPSVFLNTDMALAYYIGDDQVGADGVPTVDKDLCQCFGSGADTNLWLPTWNSTNWAGFTSVPTSAPTAAPTVGTGRAGKVTGGGGGGHCQINMGLKDSTGYSSYFVYLYAKDEAQWMKDFGTALSKMSSLGQEASLKSAV